MDALIARVTALPGPAWLPYLIGAILIAMVGTGWSWLDGSQEPGTFAFTRVYNDLYMLYPLAVMHYLTVTARKSMEAFRPALGELDSDYSNLQYEFTTMRRPMVAVATAIGVTYATLSLVFDPGIAGISDRSSVPNVVFLAIVSTVAGVSFVVLLFFVFRQMGLVVRVTLRATAINLYDPASHTAFARLTLRSSLSLALSVYVYTLYAALVGSPREGISIADLVAVVAIVAGAIGVFLIPLAGLHGRLLSEKTRLTTEVNRRFDLATREVHRRADAQRLEGIGELSTLLGALVVERDTLKRMSTWPWQAETLRGFLSSVALPILLWFITNLLGRFLGS